MDTPLVLVVDDDAGIRDLLADLVALLGYAVLTAADGYEALETVELARIDVIVTDLDMPEMNGRQLAAALQKRQCVIPLIIMTGNHVEESITRQMGAVAVLAKPFEVAVLASTIDRVVRMSQRLSLQWPALATSKT